MPSFKLIIGGIFHIVALDVSFLRFFAGLRECVDSDIIGFDKDLKSLTHSLRVIKEKSS